MIENFSEWLNRMVGWQEGLSDAVKLRVLNIRDEGHGILGMDLPNGKEMHVYVVAENGVAGFLAPSGLGVAMDFELLVAVMARNYHTARGAWCLLPTRAGGWTLDLSFRLPLEYCDGAEFGAILTGLYMEMVALTELVTRLGEIQKAQQDLQLEDLKLRIWVANHPDAPKM